MGRAILTGRLLFFRVLSPRVFSTSCRRERHEGERRPAYFHNTGREPLRAITIGQLLDNAADKYPDRKAIVSLHEGISLDFPQFKRQADKLGAGLLELGLEPGDRIGVLGVNTVHWAVTFHAAAKAGLILVTLNPAYRSLELGGALEQVGCKALIADHKFRGTDYPGLIAEVAPGMSEAPSAAPLSLKELPSLRYVIVATEERLPGCYRYKDVLEMGQSFSKLREVEEKIQPDDPACIQFSSGTTGKPKACVLSHFGTVNNGHFFGLRLGYREKHHTVCLQNPMFHIFGSTLCLLCSADFGVTIVLPGPYFKKEETINALKAHKCNVIYGTPTMYVDVCNEVRARLGEDEELRKACSDFDVVVSGGAICTPALFTTISQVFNCTNLQSAFGLTETSPICATNTRSDTFEQRTTTVGYVADHLEVKIVDGEGRMVGFDEPGEAWYRSYANFLGYWGDEEKTREAITEARWFKSGDILTLTEDGYLTVIGRIKDMINRGGENIFPSEIEQFLNKHPKIKDIQVYAVSDRRLGEDVAASILTKENEKLTTEEILAYCKGKISYFKIPKYIRFPTDYPKTPSGKVQKNVLRQIHEEELGRTS